MNDFVGNILQTK